MMVFNVPDNICSPVYPLTRPKTCGVFLRYFISYNNSNITQVCVNHRSLTRVNGVAIHWHGGELSLADMTVMLLPRHKKWFKVG